MKRLIVLTVLVLLLTLSGLGRQPVHAHKDFCDTGCWAGTQSWITACKNSGGTIDYCLGRGSEMYYACLCSCRHTC
jgi:hypothetical protein